MRPGRRRRVSPTPRTGRRVIAPLLARVGNPLEWNEVDKVLIVQAIQAPAILVMMLRARHLLAHPAVEPYLDRRTLAVLLGMLWAVLGLTAVFTVVGVLVRRRRRLARWFLYVVMQFWWLGFAVIAYVHGLATTPLWTIFPFIGFYCLLLFDLRVALSGMVGCVVVLFGTTVAERLGLLPYGPLFSAWPEVGGRIADEWLWSSMTWPLILSAVTFSIFVLILRLNRRQAEQLAAMSARLRTELEDAADYVRSVLPPPLAGAHGVIAEWCFVPSEQLGGDAFTYAALDRDSLMVALLDVCGHGVGPALHAISVLHALRPPGFGGIDLADPAAVARAINEAFAMERHHDLYLSLWYGVYHRPTRRLRFVSAGHPPAILRTGATRAVAHTLELATGAPTVGVVDGATFAAREVVLEPFAELFVFSDGVFEIEAPDGRMLGWPEFVTALARPVGDGGRKVDDVLAFVRRFGAREQLEDDFSLLRLEFLAS